VPFRYTKQLKTYTGSFEEIRLDFTPEEPVTEDERIPGMATYTYELANLHVYLEGTDAAEKTPSAYMTLLLGQLLSGLADLLASQTIAVQWMSDPWQMDLRGDAAHNRLFITLHVPDTHRVVMRDVSVPLDQFGRELIRICQRWSKYLDTTYHDEVIDFKLGKHYHGFERSIKEAQQVLQTASTI